MLESSNLNSIIAANEAIAVGTGNRAAIDSTDSQPLHAVDGVEQIGAGKSNNDHTTNKNASNSGSVSSLAPTLASAQLAAGMLQIFEPPLLRAKGQLKELIGKQNKIYIDLSAEKYKLDNVEVSNLQHMMSNIKIYREKLIRIKKQMQNIYQRTKVLKKRALYIQTCKQKDLQRILQKQQQEESLIAKQQQEP